LFAFDKHEMNYAKNLKWSRVLTEETESASSVHGSLPVEREEHMKRKSRDEKADELRAEYDLGERLETGVRGKYADRFRDGTNLVLPDQDVAQAFPTDQGVNDALRLVIELEKLPKSGSKSKTKC